MSGRYIRIRIQNAGGCSAEKPVIHVKFPEGTRIDFVDRGVFEVMDGGEGGDYVKFTRRSIPPYSTLPDIYISAKKEGVFVKPEIWMECRGVPRFPALCIYCDCE